MIELATRMIKIEIHLTKAQIERSNEILSRCHKLWNLYVEEAIGALSEHHFIPNNYEFDKNIYQTRIKVSDPEYWKALPNKARKDATDRAYTSFMRNRKEKGRYNLRFRSWFKNPISSFFFIKDGIRLIDSKHIWIPILHTIKMKEEWSDKIPIESITSGRICYDRGIDKWYVCFIGTTDVSYDNRPFHGIEVDGLGIDLGIKRYMTTWFGNAPNDAQLNYDPCRDPKLLMIDDKINDLNRVIDLKIQWNKVIHGYSRHENGKNIPKESKRSVYNTNAIQKLRKRISRLYAKARNYRKDMRDKLCNTLVRFQPKFICMEDLDTLSMIKKSKNMIHGSSFRRHVSQTSFYSTLVTMQWQCKKYEIPFIQVDPFYPSSQLCSLCGHQQSMPLSKRNYKCPECGMKMDRDLNAAKNLYLYGKNLMKGRITEIA